MDNYRKCTEDDIIVYMDNKYIITDYIKNNRKLMAKKRLLGDNSAFSECSKKELFEMLQRSNKVYILENIQIEEYCNTGFSKLIDMCPGIEKRIEIIYVRALKGVYKRNRYMEAEDMIKLIEENLGDTSMIRVSPWIKAFLYGVYKIYKEVNKEKLKEACESLLRNHVYTGSTFIKEHSESSVVSPLLRTTVDIEGRFKKYPLYGTNDVIYYIVEHLLEDSSYNVFPIEYLAHGMHARPDTTTLWIGSEKNFSLDEFTLNLKRKFDLDGNILCGFKVDNYI